MKFEVVTPLGFTVRTSEGYWQRLMGKHPDLEELITAYQTDGIKEGEMLWLK